MTEDEILAWCGSIERRPLPETRYTLSEMIAFGGFGAVFDAHLVDGASGSAVPPDVRFVVKIFHPNLYADPSHRKLIDAECENSRTVSHQLRSANLVTTFEHLQLQLPGGQSTVGIVQEQCSTTLEKAVARITGEDRQFEPPDLFHLVRGLLLGVQSLHDAGLVHGDLKPSNILLHAGGVDLLRHGASLLQLTPKVADFTTLGKVGEPAPKLAKDKWRPPENYQLDSVENWIPIARNASPQTDVYAAGKIIQWLCQKTKRCPTPIQRLADRMISDKLDARPVAVDRHLVSQASQDFDLIALLKNAGYSPERHPVFVGRKATLQRIDNCERHVAKDPECGRLTLLVGESGIGKSAIMHHLSAPSDHTAGHPAFFFIRERRQSAEQMLRTLIEMVRKRYPSVTKDIEARRENPETEFAELIAAAGAAEFESGCILRVLIDAVDESCNPVAVTRGLPLHIPSGVHLIVAMRPAAGAGLDSYLTPLQTVSHIDQIDLTRNSGCNRDDLREYFQDRRKEVGTDPELLEALVDATGGIFRIAVVIADQLLATDRPLPSPSTVKNFSIASGAGEAERLMRVYQHSWQQLKGWIEESYDSAMLAKHVDFLGYLSVAQSPLTESQLCVWLQCDAAEIQQMFENTHWLIQQRFDDNDIHQSLPHYALSHASVGEFLVSRQFGGPLLSRNRLHRYQAAIAKHHFDQADRDGWRRVDAYGR
ncbi:MAG: protein kinase [Planctomycetota bacterium]